MIIETLIEAAKDSKAEYAGFSESKLTRTHLFRTTSKSSCVKSVSTFETILASRRVSGIAIFIENTDVVVVEVKKLC